MPNSFSRKEAVFVSLLIKKSQLHPILANKRDVIGNLFPSLLLFQMDSSSSLADYDQLLLLQFLKDSPDLPLRKAAAMFIQKGSNGAPAGSDSGSIDLPDGPQNHLAAVCCLSVSSPSLIRLLPDAAFLAAVLVFLPLKGRMFHIRRQILRRDLRLSQASQIFHTVAELTDVSSVIMVLDPLSGLLVHRKLKAVLPAHGLKQQRDIGSPPV